MQHTIKRSLLQQCIPTLLRRELSYVTSRLGLKVKYRAVETTPYFTPPPSAPLPPSPLSPRTPSTAPPHLRPSASADRSPFTQQQHPLVCCPVPERYYYPRELSVIDP